MKIRNYTEKDLDVISKLGSLLHEKYTFSLDEFSKCLILEDNQKIIGFIIYSIIYDRAEIVDIIINPSNRLKGYGEKLLKYTIDEIINKGCLNVTLEVSVSNTSAINLYKKLGFNIEAIRKRYYNNEDGYLMKKDLR